MVKIDQIIRTKRKRIALIVKRDGSLIVRAPKQSTDEQIRVVVEKKEAWIKAKQELVRTIYPKATPKEYVNGEGFLFLGKSYRLEIIEVGESLLILKEVFLLDRRYLSTAQDVFIQWYKEQALQVISDRVAWHAAKFGFNYQQVKITSAQMRWGSCSSKGVLSFAWRLVMAPVPVIDYVVAHELVHTVEKSHGKAFWAKLRAVMPDYKQRIEWLEINGHLLTIV